VVDLDNNRYVVCRFPYKNTNVPVILDYAIFEQIKKLGKSWHITDNGCIATIHKMIHNGDEIATELYLHDIIMKMNHMDKPNAILHINKLGIDNRIENLIYDTNDKNITKNIKKKKRVVELPYDSHIDPDCLPSYVWYNKEESTHGDRFVVDIGHIAWKSTSSKKLSLRYKLEETKKYLRNLKTTQPQIFLDHSMNGDLNLTGKKLLESFYEIANKANYTHLTKINNIENTDEYLSEDLFYLSNAEIQLLKLFDPNGERINFR